MNQSWPTPGDAPGRQIVYRPHEADEATPTEVVIAVAAVAMTATVVALNTAQRVARPVVRILLRPPLVPRQLQPGQWLAPWGRWAVDQRQLAQVELARLLDVLVPVVLAEVLARVDLTAIVKENVDLDSVVATVDLNAAVARVDVDAIAGGIDIDVILDRLDLTAMVAERVDLNAVVAGVDLNAAVARVDIDAIAGTVDIEAIIDRLDLAGIAERVINAIDLPEIIRESTASVASETVRGARMRGIAADEALTRTVDRLLLRRGRATTPKPGQP